MGIKEWIFRRQIRKLQQSQGLDSVLDEAIKAAVKRSTDATNTANKVLKLKLLEQQTQKTLDKVNELSQDDDEDDEDEEEDFADGLLKGLANQFIKSKFPPAQAEGLSNMVNKLTPEQIEDLKNKFLNP